MRIVEALQNVKRNVSKCDKYNKYEIDNIKSLLCLSISNKVQLGFKLVL